MPAPSNYCGKLPFELYVELLNKFPQNLGENDVQWLERIKRDAILAQALFGTKQFSRELTEAVAKRTMAQAGARRVGQANPGVALLSPDEIWPAKMGPHQQMADVAARFRADETQFQYATGAYKLLLEQFDATTPVDGSIFWNGINELALAKLVDKWNGEHEIFGQLEATTAARYVNKQFVWEEGGVFQKYFTDVSERLGGAARGHVTAVVRCGLRFDSILTTTELPRMLKGMDEQLVKGLAPDITDITIVVIQPKWSQAQPIASFTNHGITQIRIVTPINKYINGRDDCTQGDSLQPPIRVKDYWTKRGEKPESAAATRIKKDFETLTKWP